MKFNKIFSFLAAGCLMMGAVSCTEEVEYTPAQNGDENGVYFSTDEDNAVNLTPDQSSFEIYLHRVSTEGELTVSLTSSVTDEDGKDASAVIKVPATATFAAGADIATVVVTDVFSEIVPETEYTINVSVDGADSKNPTTSYGPSSATFTVTYAPWSDFERLGVGTYQLNAIFTPEFDQYVYKSHSLLNENLEMYVVPSPFSDVDFEIQITLNKQDKVEIDGVECFYVTTNLLNSTIVNTNYGEEMWWCDTYTYLTKVIGDSHEEALSKIEANGLHRAYFNPVQGRFYLYMISYISLGNFGESLETLQLPGDYKDYYLEFNKTGNYVDARGTEFTVIQAMKSEDVYGFSYRNVAGTPTEEEVADILADVKTTLGDEMITDASTNLYVPYTENGKYTIVAFGFSQSGDVVCTQLYEYKAETVKAEEKFHSVGIVEYTDGFIYALYNGIDPVTWEVELQEHNEIPGYFRLVDPYYEWPYNVGEDYALSLEGKFFMEVHAENPDQVYLNTFELGVALGNGPMVGTSHAGFLIEQGKTAEEVAASGVKFGKMKNNKITFPAKALLINFPEDSEDPTALYYTNFQANDKGNVIMGSNKFCIDFSYIEGMNAPRKEARNRSCRISSSLQRVNAAAASVRREASKRANISIEDYNAYRFQNLKTL